MSAEIIYPRSPKDEVSGFPYFARMCHKIRLQQAGDLHEDYQPNLGQGFDKWTCEFLQVEYSDLVKIVESGLSDDESFQWCVQQGAKLSSPQLDWWMSYMRNRGHKDDLSEKLNQRKVEAGFGDRDDIDSFFDFIDAEEGRDLA